MEKNPDTPTSKATALLPRKIREKKCKDNRTELALQF
jgi:hypothetical protein